MTKKQELLKAYEEVKGKALDCIVLDIHMPTGETETITNPNVEEKIKYIEKTYNDDLVHPSCKQIYIEEYSFIECQDGFDFGLALGALKYGKKVARRGWNGKGMFIFIHPGRVTEFENLENTLQDSLIGSPILRAEDEFGVRINPYFMIKNVDGSLSTWVPNINDVLAEDWYIL